MSLLTIENVRKIYRKGELEVEALRGVDLTINSGEFLSIMGPSGSGKTTLLNIIGCLDNPSEGRVLYNDNNLAELNAVQLSDYRKDNIAFIFQSYNLIPVLTVRENIELPLVIEKKFSKDELRVMAERAMDQVGLLSMADRFPRELSGGQEQRVAIARALVKDPLVVLADEPTANLDSVMAEEIISVMQQMNRDRDTTFVFSTHDPRVEKHAKRIVVLRDGLIDSDNEV